MEEYLQPFIADIYGVREKYARDEISAQQYASRKRNIVKEANDRIVLDVDEGVLTEQVRRRDLRAR